MKEHPIIFSAPMVRAIHMNDYARATGGSIRTDLPVVDNRQPLPPLSDAERERTAKAKAFVHKHLPDMIPLIRELVAVGYLPGWRGVHNFYLRNDDQ